MQDFLEKYASDPDFAELCVGLQDMVGTIHGAVQAHLDYGPALEAYKAACLQFMLEGGDMT
jgi:hypothetical protein